MAAISPQSHPGGIPSWFNYRTVWRWHFYAGLFCVPFVIWLSITGSIYLFKPQIERWLDRPYDSLSLKGPKATAEAQVNAALAAVPGSNLHYYELPLTPRSATRIIVGRQADEFRVYVNPQTLQILNIVSEDSRPMKIVFRLHGELLMGDKGSLIVEVAASWAIVMILTGLYLWLPRQTENLAGVLFIRLGKGSRIFWRDLHGVTGVYVSAFALFLLLTGLPWAKSWGGYLKKARAMTGAATVRQDWTTGRSSEVTERMAMNRDSMEGMPMEHAGHMGHAVETSRGSVSYEPLDRIIATLMPLQLAYPVLISPPTFEGSPWTAKSDSQNRPLRTNLTLNAQTGALLKRENFDQRGIVDRVVGIGVAAHEGQLFGLVNQVIGLCTAMGLVLLSGSAIVLWWRRRHVGVLGAPLPIGRTRWSFPLLAAIVALGIYLPAMGASLIVVALLEKFVFSQIPSVSRWLGLVPG
ncbi:PepSY-associated TM helix domain-containing protein [Granulicella arctica]|uniref:PepSY-associated TM helix domain-containing protein n=1 Tax=Granulicella arctica TaxID=940613 RepID=UPI0021E01F4C|nr:PepSY domain-containing protein [Granulicella arctica]